jgi:hypothetical protein
MEEADWTSTETDPEEQDVDIVHTIEERLEIQTCLFIVTLSIVALS